LSLIGVPEHFFISLIRFQPFDPERHSTTFLSGREPATQKGLLITMGIFMSLAIVGMIAEVVFRMARKAKIQNDEGIYRTGTTTYKRNPFWGFTYVHTLLKISVDFIWDNLAETYLK